MSDKDQLSTSSWCRWSNQWEPWQLLILLTVWWWVHVSKDLVLVSLSSAAGGIAKAVLTITCDSLGP